MERTITERAILAAPARARARGRGWRWSLRILLDELHRIPAYQDEAEALRQGLRRARTNSPGREQR